jgi:hypothetical protein
VASSEKKRRGPSSPRYFLDLFIAKDFRADDFGSADSKELNESDPSTLPRFGLGQAGQRREKDQYPPVVTGSMRNRVKLQGIEALRGAHDGGREALEWKGGTTPVAIERVGKALGNNRDIELPLRKRVRNRMKLQGLQGYDRKERTWAVCLS